MRATETAIELSRLRTGKGNPLGLGSVPPQARLSCDYFKTAKGRLDNGMVRPGQHRNVLVGLFYTETDNIPGTRRLGAFPKCRYYCKEGTHA